MTVLVLQHQDDAGPGVFTGYDELASFAQGRPPRPASEYEAAIVLGGDANVDDDHEWLVEEKRFVADLLERDAPVLGVCLGAQLIADAAGAHVGPLPGGTVAGWQQVTTLVEHDPVLGDADFTAFEWHRYGFRTPAAATELACSDAGPEAFRLGNALAIQFHAEVDAATVESWIRDYGPSAGVDEEALRAETRKRIGAWNAFGRALCARFLSALPP